MRTNETAVVVSAHLDDAVFSAASVLGQATLVVTVLAGIPRKSAVGSWDDSCGTSDSRKRMRDRRREDAAALALYGASYLHLDFLGGQYVQRHRKAVGVLTARMAETLEPYLAGPFVVYSPAGIGHPEHGYVRDAVLSVRPDATLYADLPYTAHAAIEAFELPHVLPVTHTIRRDIVLSARAVRRKIEAATCYASQIAPLEQVFGAFLTRSTLGREIYWAVG